MHFSLSCGGQHWVSVSVRQWECGCVLVWECVLYGCLGKSSLLELCQVMACSELIWQELTRNLICKWWRILDTAYISKVAKCSLEARKKNWNEKKNQTWLSWPADDSDVTPYLFSCRVAVGRVRICERCLWSGCSERQVRVPCSAWIISLVNFGRVILQQTLVLLLIMHVDRSQISQPGFKGCVQQSCSQWLRHTHTTRLGEQLQVSSLG